ncbi:sigma 54-interacting transcriptional regulator [Neobacillus cucumis]|nr:sigma 54-interacting transcriptional regulator [Neobacillus cucumis]
MARIGSEKVIPINVRIIAATNQNLSNFVQNNDFRVDLFYR